MREEIRDYGSQQEAYEAGRINGAWIALLAALFIGVGLYLDGPERPCRPVSEIPR